MTFSETSDMDEEVTNHYGGTWLLFESNVLGLGTQAGYWPAALV